MARKPASSTPRPSSRASSSKSAKSSSTSTSRKTTKAPSKAPAAAKSPATKPPARRKSYTPKKKPTTTKSRTPVSWKRWLLTELAVVTAGAAVGLGIAGGFLWKRATGDVEAYLASPPRPIPGVVWSAPMQLREGQRASMASLAGDLLAAGYERAPKAGPREGVVGTFHVRADGFDIWTAPAAPGGVPLKESTVHLTIAEGMLTDVEPGSRTTLHPTVLATIGDLDESRQQVDLDALSSWVEPALLSMEDARFRQHHGIDPVGLARALVRNAVSSGDMQGGSTLTQQLAKNLFLTSERSVQRKVREVFFAAALESRLDKDELLELYLSEVYLGQMGGLPVHGVEAAARAWFGKRAQSLELHEAATIIGVIPAPNAYSPVRHPERSLERRNLVLKKLHERGHIDADQLELASSKPLQLRGLEPSRVRRAPYAVDLAVDRADTALGEGALASGGYQVYTHIQPALQRAAEEAVAVGMDALVAEHPEAKGAQVALVAVDLHTGAVVAMVGGTSYATSPFNRATEAHRQAGSTVKPLTLLAGLDMGAFTPATELDDAPLTRSYDGTRWTPKNYDGRFVGPITVRRAIETSRNIPAVLMAEEVGPSRLQRFYRDAGLADATHLPSAALGGFPVTPLELVGAYTVFADGSSRAPQVLGPIADASGSVVLDHRPQLTELASAPSAAQARSVLEGVMTDGTGRGAAKFGVEGAAGKTGTTDGGRDAWFAGLTPELAVVVWVGQDKGTLGLTGGSAALPVWARFVAATGTAGRFTDPEGLAKVSLCSESGQVAVEACPETRIELFAEGKEPDQTCELHGEREHKGLLGRLFGKKQDDKAQP